MTGMIANDLTQGRSATDSLRSLLQWWGEELVLMLPRPLRRHLRYSEHQLVACFSDDGVQLNDCRRGQAEAVVEIAPGEYPRLSGELQQQLLLLRRRSGDEVMITLPREHVLALSFHLPLEAEKNLHEVLGYELGRYAPFKIEQVYYAYRISKRSTVENKIWLSVDIVPRKQVDPLLAMVRTWGLVPSGVTVHDVTQGEEACCEHGAENLLPEAQRGGSNRVVNRMVKVLTLSALLLLLAVAGYPILLQELQIATLQQQLEGVKRDAATVESMQQEMERVASDAAFVDEVRLKSPEILDVLNSLSKILPDDTWLERLETRGTRIRIQGLSADPSSLIERLENSALLQQVSFDSPIVKDSRLERFRFQIVAQMTVKEGA